jgi:hypothetical protein
MRRRVLTSNCGEVTLRGTPHQLVEKYEALASENNNDETQRQQYLQHAEHYTRMIGDK